jgi:hypothetical protein
MRRIPQFSQARPSKRTGRCEPNFRLQIIHTKISDYRSEIEKCTGMAKSFEILREQKEGRKGQKE